MTTWTRCRPARSRFFGLVDELDGREFEWLCEVMRLHSDGHNMREVAILACWDADRLDLGSVGIEPQPDRLCTAAARAPNVIAEAMRLTQRARDALSHCVARHLLLRPRSSSLAP